MEFIIIIIINDYFQFKCIISKQFFFVAYKLAVLRRLISHTTEFDYVNIVMYAKFIDCLT